MTMDLCVKSLTGQVEMLTNFYVSRSNGVNGDKIITVSGVKTEENSYAYSMVQNEAIFIYDDEEYVIKQHSERTLGNTTKVECKAVHKMFDDLNGNWIYDKLAGTVLLNDLFTFLLAGSGYTFSIDPTDLPSSVNVDGFGDNNSTTLLKNAIELITGEFDVSKKHIEIAKEIGDTTDHQIRYKLNVKNPTKEIDTSSFATYIRGYGKDGLMVDYTSPLHTVYGIKHAPPVRDDMYTDSVSLTNRIKRELNDSINISIKLTYVELLEMGIQDIKKGDYAWCIIEPFNIDVKIRVVQVDDYSNPFKSPVFTLGSIRKKATDIIKEYSKTKHMVERVVDVGKNMIKQEALKIGERVAFDVGYDPSSKVDNSVFSSHVNSFSDHLTLYWMGGL